MILGPGMNGRETYEKILELRPGQRAVIASGFAETEDARIAQTLGAGAMVRKPYTAQALAAAIRAELSDVSRSTGTALGAGRPCTRAFSVLRWSNPGRSR